MLHPKHFIVTIKSYFMLLNIAKLEGKNRIKLKKRVKKASNLRYSNCIIIQ